MSDRRTETADRLNSAHVALRVLGLVGALTIVASGVVHLYLWGHTDGYRAVPTIGALFLLQAIIGCLLGLVVAVVSHPLTPAGGAAYMAASVAGLLVSIRWGLFGYDETLGAPWVTFWLVDELLGRAIMLVATALAWRTLQTRRRTLQSVD